MSLIKFCHVNVYLPGGRQPFLRELNFEIAAGEWVTLVGKNGCGKSLLGKLMAGLDIKYNGQILASKKASSCQLVMQNPDSQLVGETVWEDVCFGLECHGVPAELIAEKGALALKRVGLPGFEARSVHTLSGGQKQLLAMAGAIALKPSIIIADEVTSMLDPASSQQLLRVLQELHGEGVTIIMITQLLEELAYADRVITIDKGNIVYQGSKEGFFYNGFNGAGAVCEEIGLEPPYSVRVAKRLINQGVQLHGYPIGPEELLEVVDLR